MAYEFNGCYPYDMSTTPSGSPLGLDGWSVDQGSNVWYVGGKRLSGTKDEMKKACQNRCIRWEKNYRFYIESISSCEASIIRVLIYYEIG